jgi:hypothetical protein
MLRSNCVIAVLTIVLVSTVAFLISPPLSAQPPVRVEVPATVPVHTWTPAEMVDLAAKDAQAIQDEHLRYNTRYIALYNVPPNDRNEHIQLLNFALNSLSRRRGIVYADIVPNTENTLLRLDLRIFALDPKLWDKFVTQGSGPIRAVKKIDLPEPYFYQQIKKGGKHQVKKTRTVPWYAPDGRQYVDKAGQPATKTETYYEDIVEPTSFEIVHAPWLNQASVVDLAEATYSDYAIIRGDWFLANALIAPAYNELLQFKTIQDFQKFVRYRGRDKDLAVKGVVVESAEVALHSRAALYTPTVLGSYWETFDYFTSIDDNDLLTNLKKEERDAGEVIANGPNGLQYYLLIDGQGKVLDFADPNVAVDSQTSWRNKIVWNGYSCITCHSQGMKDLNDEVRALSRPPFALLVKEHQDFQQVIDLFSTPIEEPINLTKATYVKTVGLSTQGMTPQQMATALQRVFLAYHQKSIDIDDAAAEVGCTPDEVRSILGATINPDHTLTQLLAGRIVRRDQWEFRGFAQLATIVHEHRTVQ